MVYFSCQIIPNSFLANPNTSATFATILVRFLLDRLDEMGSNLLFFKGQTSQESAFNLFFQIILFYPGYSWLGEGGDESFH